MRHKKFTYEPPLTMSERILQARTKQADAKTIAESCYWQGALDALEAFTEDRPMPEVVGTGIKT